MLKVFSFFSSDHFDLDTKKKQKTARHRPTPAPHFTASVCSPGHILTNETKSSMLNGTSQLCHWNCNSLLLVPKGTSATPSRGTDGVKNIHSVGVTNKGSPTEASTCLVKYKCCTCIRQWRCACVGCLGQIESKRVYEGAIETAVLYQGSREERCAL